MSEPTTSTPPYDKADEYDNKDYSTSRFENALAERTWDAWLEGEPSQEIYNPGDETTEYALVYGGTPSQHVLLHLHSSGAVYVEAEGSMAAERFGALLREYDQE